MAPSPWRGFCQTLLHPGRGTEQSRRAGSAPIPIPAVSTTAQRCGVSLCLCNVSLCLVPPLFITIYCLFIILPTTTPAVFIIECSPGAEGVPPPELAPGLVCAVTSKRCPLWCPCPGEWGRKGTSSWLGGDLGPWSPVLTSPRLPLWGGLTSSPITGTSTGVGGSGGTHALSPLLSPPRGGDAGRSLNALNSEPSRVPLPLGDFQRTDGHSRYPGELQAQGVSVHPR